MTKTEIAKKIANGEGCEWIVCGECPLGPLPAFCTKGMQSRSSAARDWLAKNENPTIGWPGNVEEMRQYEGQVMEFSDMYNFTPSGSGVLTISEDAKRGSPDPLPYRMNRGFGFTYCRPMPRSFPELTLSEIADKFGIPLDQLRIKDGTK